MYIDANNVGVFTVVFELFGLGLNVIPIKPEVYFLNCVDFV